MKHLKKAKRLIASIITMALIMSMMTMTAFASTLTLKTNAVTDVSGHTYTLYQILTGTSTQDETTEEYYLENLAWGSSVYVEGGIDYRSALADVVDVTDTTAAAFASGLGSSVDNSTASSIYTAIGSSSASSYKTIDGSSETLSATVDDGYYLIVDSTSSRSGDAVSRYILVMVAGDTTVTLKDTLPTLNKQIYHDDETEYTTEGDSQIGDTVNFLITLSVPDTTGYSSYTYEVTDTLSDGLTFDGSSSVTIRYGTTESSSNSEINSTYYTVSTATSSTDDDGVTTSTFTVTFDDFITMLSALGISTSDNIYIYFTCTLNSSAEVSSGTSDSVYETNTAYLTYSDNPNAETTETTEEVTVYEWTFEITVEKVGTDKTTQLSGAKFVLSTDPDLTVTYDSESGSLTVEKDGSTVTASEYLIALNASGTTYTVDSTGTVTNYIITAGSVTISGLNDDTTYYLYEISAPEGYDLLDDPVSFKITAGYDSTGTKLASLALSSNETSSGETTISEDGSTLMIVNTNSASLPGTGGAGTTMLYFLGTILVAGAVVLLVVKRTRSHAA